MRILITGSTGLVGSSIIEMLNKEYTDIWSISYSKTPEYHLDKWIRTDIRNVIDTMRLITQLGKFDILIHNAALVKNAANSHDYSEIVNSNILFTSELFKWAEENVRNAVIYISSLSFIKRPIPSVIDEEVDTCTNNLYSFSKLAGEQLLGYIKTDASKIILRLSSPVSPCYEKMPDSVIRKMILNAQERGIVSIYGNGSRKQDFVSVRDIGSAVLACIKNPISGIYNIASGDSIEMKELGSLIATRLKAKIKYIGSDPLESEIWNISIKKAIDKLHYNPKFNSKKAVLSLLDNL